MSARVSSLLEKMSIGCLDLSTKRLGTARLVLQFVQLRLFILERQADESYA
jgi:hypothetical protein